MDDHAKNTLTYARKNGGWTDAQIIDFAMDYLSEVGCSFNFHSRVVDKVEEINLAHWHYSLLMEEVPATQSRPAMLRLVVWHSPKPGMHNVEEIVEVEQAYDAITTFEELLVERFPSVPASAYRVYNGTDANLIVVGSPVEAAYYTRRAA